MNIRHQTRKLEKSIESLYAIKRHYGDNAKKLDLRLAQLSQAPDLDAMRTLPAANCHELKADRAGELAVDISPNHRMLYV